MNDQKKDNQDEENIVSGTSLGMSRNPQCAYGNYLQEEERNRNILEPLGITFILEAQVGRKGTQLTRK